MKAWGSNERLVGVSRSGWQVLYRCAKQGHAFSCRAAYK